MSHSPNFNGFGSPLIVPSKRMRELNEYFRPMISTNNPNSDGMHSSKRATREISRAPFPGTLQVPTVAESVGESVVTPLPAQRGVSKEQDCIPLYRSSRDPFSFGAATNGTDLTSHESSFLPRPIDVSKSTEAMPQPIKHENHQVIRSADGAISKQDGSLFGECASSANPHDARSMDFTPINTLLQGPLASFASEDLADLYFTDYFEVTGHTEDYEPKIGLSDGLPPDGNEFNHLACTPSTSVTSFDPIPGTTNPHFTLDMPLNHPQTVCNTSFTLTLPSFLTGHQESLGQDGNRNSMHSNEVSPIPMIGQQSLRIREQAGVQPLVSASKPPLPPTRRKKVPVGNSAVQRLRHRGPHSDVFQDSNNSQIHPSQSTVDGLVCEESLVPR